MFSLLPLLLLLLLLRLRPDSGLVLAADAARAWLSDGKLPKPGGGGAAAALTGGLLDAGAADTSSNPGGGGSVTRAGGGGRVTRAVGGGAATTFGDARDRRVDVVSGGRLTDTVGPDDVDVKLGGAATAAPEPESSPDETASAGEGVRDRSCAGVDGSVTSAAAPQPPPVARGGGSLSSQLSWEEGVVGDGAALLATPAKDVGAVGEEEVGGRGRDAVSGGDAAGSADDEAGGATRRGASVVGSRIDDATAGVGSVGVNVKRCAGGGGPSCRPRTSSRVSTSSGYGASSCRYGQSSFPHRCLPDPAHTTTQNTCTRQAAPTRYAKEGLEDATPYKPHIPTTNTRGTRRTPLTH